MKQNPLRDFSATSRAAPEFRWQVRRIQIARIIYALVFLFFVVFFWSNKSN